MIDLQGSLPAIDADRLYTTCQLANVLGVSPKSVTRYRRSGVEPAGKLRAIRVGKVWRIRGADALAWIEAQQPGPDRGPHEAAAADNSGADLVDELLDAEGF
jgi:hypothetical protein